MLNGVGMFVSCVLSTHFEMFRFYSVEQEGGVNDELGRIWKTFFKPVIIFFQEAYFYFQLHIGFVLMISEC
jgi:hypothetical protein